MTQAERTAHAEPFPKAAREALAMPQMRANVLHATTTIRSKRALAVAEVPDWEELRDAGAAIKDYALLSLERLLVELEAAVTARGGIVHWARDGAEANSIVTEIVRAEGVDEVVKVKSLTTDEIGLNEALAAAGIHALETDLAELIVQLAAERPSHLLVPAIHKNRTEIRDLFREQLGLDALTDDPPSSRRRLARSCATPSCEPASPSRAPTSPVPTRAASSWSSPKGTVGCARRCPKCS